MGWLSIEATSLPSKIQYSDRATMCEAAPT